MALFKCEHLNKTIGTYKLNDIEEIAREMKKYPTQFITCHCTGLEAYDIMKDIMGDKLNYVHSGDEIFI